MITTKDKIGYISRRTVDGKTVFKYIEAKIKQVRVGQTKTSVYSDRFRALDAEELEDNTEIVGGLHGLVLVNEPFIIRAEQESKHYQAVVDYWNEHGATSLLGEKYEGAEG